MFNKPQKQIQMCKKMNRSSFVPTNIFDNDNGLAS